MGTCGGVGRDAAPPPFALDEDEFGGGRSRRPSGFIDGDDITRPLLLREREGGRAQDSRTDRPRALFGVRSARVVLRSICNAYCALQLLRAVPVPGWCA